MALDDLKYRWTTPTDLTLTSLASLADGNIWQSGLLTDGPPTFMAVRFSYELVFNATPVAGDHLQFYIPEGDEAASNEIWDGNIGETIGQITTAAAIAAVLAAFSGNAYHAHYWQTSHGTTFKGSFRAYEIKQSHQLLVRPVGEALAAGTHRLRVSYYTLQRQAS